MKGGKYGRNIVNKDKEKKTVHNCGYRYSWPFKLKKNVQQTNGGKIFGIIKKKNVRHFIFKESIFHKYLIEQFLLKPHSEGL